MNIPFDPVIEEDEETDDEGDDVDAVDEGIRLRMKVKFIKFAR